MDSQFSEGWSEVTKHYLGRTGARGSRLHKGNDGLYWAYAQWNSDEDRQNAFREPPTIPAREKMIEAIAQRYDKIVLEIVADHLLVPDQTPPGDERNKTRTAVHIF